MQSLIAAAGDAAGIAAVQAGGGEGDAVWKKRWSHLESIDDIYIYNIYIFRFILEPEYLRDVI